MTLPAPLLRVLEGGPPEPPREAALLLLREAVADALGAGGRARVLFVCTHNSRRSQFAQVWGRVAAVHHGLPGVETFSGGTETTRVHPAVIGSLERGGFRAERSGPEGNPEYRLRFAADEDPVILVSKRFDDARNPSGGFVAVMTCSEADAACPSVPGATARISLPYKDPKRADGTPAEAEVYDATAHRIARELDWALGGIAR